MKPIKAHLKFSGVWGIIFSCFPSFCYFLLLLLLLFPVPVPILVLALVTLFHSALAFTLLALTALLRFLCLMVLCHDIRGWILKQSATSAYVPSAQSPCPAIAPVAGARGQSRAGVGADAATSASAVAKWLGARQKIFISIRHKNLLKMKRGKMRSAQLAKDSSELCVFFFCFFFLHF